MVIEHSLGSLNLYVACSYQPKIQTWVQPGQHLELQLKYNHNSDVYTYVLWVNDSNEKKNHIGTLLWRIWIKFKMATDDILFVIVIEDIYMDRKHSFVYLNMHMLRVIVECTLVYIVI